MSLSPRRTVIAKPVQADEYTVRDVIHRFKEIGLACQDPRWAGGRPRLLRPDDEDFVIQAAITRPAKLSRPFTHWSIRKLAACLRRVHVHVHVHVIRIGREALRCLLARRGVTFQRTKARTSSRDCWLTNPANLCGQSTGRRPRIRHAGRFVHPVEKAKRTRDPHSGPSGGRSATPASRPASCRAPPFRASTPPTKPPGTLKQRLPVGGQRPHRTLHCDLAPLGSSGLEQG